MFINSRNIITSANRLAGKSIGFKSGVAIKNITAVKNVKQLHTTKSLNNYAATAQLPIPNNIDAAESTRFSPQRTRDISANVIVSHFNQGASPMSTIDITADNSFVLNQSSSDITTNYDPHVQSYDCFGAVSLNSVMQSNVPTPFGGMHKFSHLNMPGGQWSQEYKFTAQNLHSSHYRALRDNARAGWAVYDPNATITTNGKYLQTIGKFQIRRCFSTKSNEATTADTLPPLSKKEKLKKLVKEYGSTVIVFHVGISLVSLGGCYLLISSGINMMPILEYLGLATSTLSTKIATGSTFVVAYAIHKVFAPVRISITLGATPFIVRYLRSKGILKIKPTPTIK